jgi:hypothetical protein
MESYHTDSSASRADERVQPRQLRPFEYIATPPITHLIMAILDYCRVGGSFAPGVRQLAEMSGVTLGLISGLLYELDRSGWISYDGHVIMVLRGLDDSDQVIADHLIADHLIDQDDSRVDERFDASGSDDQIPDRSNDDMVLLAAAKSMKLDSESAAAKIPCTAENDHAADRHPAMLQLAEFGTNPTLRRRAIAARPDLTPQQVRDTWAHFEQRIAAGRCSAAAFHAAIADGQIHAAPSDPAMPLNPQSYAADPAFQLGSQSAPDESAQRNALYRDAHWRAVDLLGPGAAYQDMAIVVEVLVAGGSDESALTALADQRSAVRR